MNKFKDKTLKHLISNQITLALNESNSTKAEEKTFCDDSNSKRNEDRHISVFIKFYVKS